MGMQDRQRAGKAKGGWFKVEHAALQTIKVHEPKRFGHVRGVYVAMLELANEQRNVGAKGECEASANDIAAVSGFSAATVKRALPVLVQVGLLRKVERGTRGATNRWLVVGSEGASERVSESRPPVPGELGFGSEGASTRARPIHGEEKTEEEEKNAPDGAGSLSAGSSSEGDVAAAIAQAHSDLVATHTKVRPRPPTARDREAAADLARRLDPADWREQLDLALRVGLDGNDYMRGAVVTLAGLARHVNELVARAERADTGPPPAGWDEPDVIPLFGGQPPLIGVERARAFESAFGQLPADHAGWTRDEALDWAADWVDRNPRFEFCGQEFWEALQLRLGLSADAEAVPPPLPAEPVVVEAAVAEPDAELAQ
jgi:hypothetical protein